MKNLEPSVFIWYSNLDMNFQTSRPKNGFIKKIFSIGHSNNDDVIKGLNTVKIRQKLIDYCVFWT